MFRLFLQFRDPALKSLWRKNALWLFPERGEPGPQLLQDGDDVLTEVHRVLAALLTQAESVVHSLAYDQPVANLSSLGPSGKPLANPFSIYCIAIYSDI
jgi:hypothetical protein